MFFKRRISPKTVRGMAHGFHHVSGAGFTLGADHGRAFANAAQGFTQVAAAANKGDFEVMLVNMMRLSSAGVKYLGFINIIHTQGFQYLRFNKMTDAAFCHNRMETDFNNSFDQTRVAHTGNSAIRANVRRNSFQCHYCACAGIFMRSCMLGGTTSIITPPLSICARPFLTSKEPTTWFHSETS